MVFIALRKNNILGHRQVIPTNMQYGKMGASSEGGPYRLHEIQQVGCITSWIRQQRAGTGPNHLYEIDRRTPCAGGTDRTTVPRGMGPIHRMPWKTLCE